MLAGPANYSLPSVDLTKLKNPEWSILNRNIFNPEGFKRPPPNAYTLPEELIKKDKRFIFHKRLKANKRVIAGPCKVGPTYNVTNYNVGKDSLQWTFTKGQRNKIIAGPFNSLLTPADYPGFKTPCAELFEEDGVLPHPFHANFTSIPKTRYPDIPGPGTYTIRDPDSGLSKSFGMAPNQDFSTEIPAPNEYDVESKIGKDCPAFSITLPLKKQPLPFRVPSPGAYMIERKFEHKEKIIMACRVPSPVLVKMPDPATYTIKGDTDNPKPCLLQC
ncbi:hypothetical protein V1264_019994 [Littorina saxatilis]|uniref:Uncharacterized protein n=1 Tax=Littorina saxatilis TaxID=31220 RepID=A0AAN9GCA5_9CAEN